ncbi:MAG TPA: AAA family ATPase [Anaerolineae bacterium]|nr:AAA family ATPase [Anaerolineae bacterium]
MKSTEYLLEISPEALCRRCDPACFVEPADEALLDIPDIIGQERAVEAIRFGLDIRSPGFNLFVTGPMGTGRRSVLQHLVAQQAAQEPTPGDWVYVNYFADPRAPRAICLPPRQGAQFRDDMERFNSAIAERLVRAFETDQYAEALDALEQKFIGVQEEALSGVESACQEYGFKLMQSASGLFVAPLHEGEALTSEAFDALPAEVRERIETDMAMLDGLLDAALRRLREHERAAQAEIEALDRSVADFTIQPLLRELEDKYATHAEVKEYLAEVRQDIVQRLDLFRDGEAEGAQERASLLDVPLAQRYRVNLFVDHRQTQGAPVIVEEMPTYEKLFGRIEYDMRHGSTMTDHTLLRPGVLHLANGGYLILDAEALFESPHMWAELKRALLTETLRIESPDSQQLVSMVTPKPESIPLRAKIILRGAPEIYYALYDYDEDFAKLFKVLAEFELTMPRTPEIEQIYGRFVRALCAEESLLPFTPEALARVVDFGAWLADYQERLSARFGPIADLVREAVYWARRAGQESVRYADVRHALAQQKRRVSLSEDIIRREILENSLIVMTEGAAVGQINGLSVVSMGGYSYGMPSRITARAYVGRGNVLDVQREVQLGGPIHGKGVLSLVGYFGGQYGTEHSLSLEASLSFEQLYDEIEGDSASSAELYALISAVALAPLRQDLAATGAVDQLGRVLAIGGVNEKIEGFFEICRSRGFTGTQGVIIPISNLRNLMLREDVVEAVRAGQFHVYAVATVDEGLSLLTGLVAGVRDAEGNFPEGSLHAMAEARLREFADRSRGERDEDDEPEEDEPCLAG